MNQSNLSEGDAKEELISKGCEMMLKGSKVIEQLARENKKLFDKIKEWIHKFIESIKKAFEGVKATSKESQAVMKYLDEVQEMWDKALVEAVKSIHHERVITNNIDYKRTANTKLAEFVKRNKIVDQKETYRISENISVKLARDIEKLLNIDVSKYANEIDSDSIIHINKDHGITGKSDHSMGDLSEIEHIEYILENYEDIEIGLGSRKYKNTDNSRAKTVILTARIDNQDIYVVEAVPDTRRKALKVVSEYKKETVSQVNHSKNTLHRTSKNELASTVSNNSISQKFENDNNILNQDRNMDRNTNGDKLTPQQQEYFKDSKVRDEQGRLMVMYHGTPSGGFTVFDASESMAATALSGNWFSDNKKMVEKNYAQSSWIGGKPQIYESYLNITNPLVIDADGQGWNNIGVEKQIRREFSYYDFLKEKRVVPEGISTDQIAKYAKAHGYDGVIINEVRDGSTKEEPSNVCCTFESNQIKNVSNETPTDNEDIRFQERNSIHLEDGTRVTKKKFLSIMNGRNYKGTRTDKKLWSIKKRLDSEYFQKYNREENVKSGEHLYVGLSDWVVECMVYNETDYKTIDVWNYDEEEINNDTKGIKDSDYDKVEGAQCSGGRMGTNRKFDKDGRTGRTDTGLSGRGTDGNTYESGGNRDFENEAGLRGDRVLKQEGNIEPDQLFSLRNVDDTDLYQATYELIEENNELQKQNELLKKQFEVTKGHKPKIEDVEKLGRKLLKEYSSKYPLRDFVDNFS